ncbi:hypothetical protein [Epilithonimonas caeni]|uniref:hypothetical protein n=1 Tax=Epilithonimonas caeni TaxID=365343 RepID=UPI0003FA4289|nr:hypothetical protein [Epilithonimonas caeni]
MEIQTGKFIDQNLSEYLRKYTSKNDMLDICTDNVSVYTLREVMMRNRKVTEENKPVFLLLVVRAKENADKEIVSATACKKDLLELLDTI